METAIVSLICVALVVFGSMTMSRGFLTSVDSSTTGLQAAGQRDEIIMRTGLSPVGTSMPDPNTLEVTLENSGHTNIAEYEKWDFIVQYYDGTGAYNTRWLPYTPGAVGDNEWGVAWIRLNGAPEIYQPGVLNPGEQIMLTARLNPAAGAGTTNMVVIATPLGIPVSTYFSP